MVIATDALIVLENNMVMGNLVYRNYENEFQPGRGATVPVRIPTTHTSNTVAASTCNISTVVESSVNVILDTIIDITLPFTPQDLTLNLVDFSEQVTAPIMRAHAQKVDTTCMARYVDVAGHYPVSATPAVSDITGARAVANILKMPMDDRRFVMHPVTEADYISINAFLNAEKRGDTQAIKNANMGRLMGIEFYMDQNTPTHTMGSGSADLACAATGIWPAAGTTGTVDACLSGGVYVAGDVFKPTGLDEWGVLAINSTATDATAIFAFQPPLVTAIPDNTVITFQNSHRSNLLFHKNAFCLAVRPLTPPLGGATYEAAQYNGLSCRIVKDYILTSKTSYMSVDILLGTKTLDRNLAVRLVDAR
jgi:hypothetical protein